MFSHKSACRSKPLLILTNRIAHFNTSLHQKKKTASKRQRQTAKVNFSVDSDHLVASDGGLVGEAEAGL